MGAFFWDCSSYSYSGLGITEYTEFLFRKERSLIWKRNIPMAEVTWELQWLPAATGASGREGFPAKNIPKERVFCLFRVNRIPSILFILLSGAEWTEWYSVYSENGIAPKRTEMPSILSIPIPEYSQKNAPHISYIGMCRPKGYGFWAVLVWKRVQNLIITVLNRVWFLREPRERLNVFSFQFERISWLRSDTKLNYATRKVWKQTGIDCRG